MATDSTTLVIVQPYVPNYRVPLFEHLAQSLKGQHVSLRIVAGEAADRQSARGDAARPDWSIRPRSRTLTVGSRTFTLTNSYPLWADADAVIVPHMGSSIEAWSALVRRRASRRVGVWGHIKSYVSKANPIDVRLEDWQLRHCDHVFAYTDSGAAYAVDRGVPKQRVTALTNTVDTAELEARRADVAPQDVSAFLASLGLTGRKIYAFIGGLDTAKRVDFLCEALDHLWRTSRDVAVLVGGAGVDSALLEPAVARGQVRMLGYVDAKAKALMSAASVAIVSPGRIGLIAVDALALRRPILTTRWPFHAPEADYLQEGVTRLSSADNPLAFADLLRRFEPSWLSVPESSWQSKPDLADMVDHFTQGVLTMLRA